MPTTVQTSTLILIHGTCKIQVTVFSRRKIPDYHIDLQCSILMVNIFIRVKWKIRYRKRKRT